MRLARETVVNFIGGVFTSIAGFVATIVIARLLGAEALGIYSLVLALLFWLDMPTTGIQQAMMKRISEGEDRGEYFSAGLVVSLFLVSISGTLALIFRDAIQIYIGADVVPLFVLLFSAQVLYGAILTGLRAQKRVGLAGLIQALERTLRTLCQVLLILLSYAVSGLLIGYVASLVVAAAVALWFYSFGLSRPRQRHFRELYDYAKYAWVSNLRGKAYAWLDTLVLGLFVSAALVGIYEVAWSLSSALVLVNRSISQILFPEVSELNEHDDDEMIREHIVEALAFSGITLFPGFVGAVVLGPELLKIYSPEFATGATVFLILIFARILKSFSNPLYVAIYALDRPDIGVRIAVPVLLVNLVFNLALVSLIGWHGAAIATAITSFVNLLLSYGYFRRLTGGVDVPLLEMGEQATASVVMGIVLWGAKSQLSESHYITIALVFVGAATYTAVLFGISSRVRTKVLGVARSF